MTRTADLFYARLDEMVDHSHPLAVMSKRLPWGAIKQSLAPHFARQIRPVLKNSTKDLLGEYEVPSLQYLKSAFNLSNEELVQR